MSHKGHEEHKEKPCFLRFYQPSVLFVSFVAILLSYVEIWHSYALVLLPQTRDNRYSVPREWPPRNFASLVPSEQRIRKRSLRCSSVRR